jgi:hypothetical protein
MSYVRLVQLVDITSNWLNALKFDRVNLLTRNHLTGSFTSNACHQNLLG